MSEIRATTISDAAGTGPITLTKQSAAKAWGFFNGTGTISLFGSGFNASSLNDSGTGNYQLNFINNMADANYASSLIGNIFHTADEGHSTAYAAISTYGSAHTASDTNRANVVVFGDLA